MKWALNLLQKVLKSVEALQQARQQRLWKAHRRSRLSFWVGNQDPVLYQPGWNHPLMILVWKKGSFQPCLFTFYAPSFHPQALGESIRRWFSVDEFFFARMGGIGWLNQPQTRFVIHWKFAKCPKIQTRPSARRDVWPTAASEFWPAAVLFGSPEFYQGEGFAETFRLNQFSIRLFFSISEFQKLWQEKMARVVVRSKAMRVPSRQPPRLPWYGLWRRLWDVENFCQRLRRCVQRAQQALHVARDTAERRVVRQTRVFLCTIPSSYQVGKDGKNHGKIGRRLMKTRAKAFSACSVYCGIARVILEIQLGFKNVLVFEPNFICDLRLKESSYVFVSKWRMPQMRKWVLKHRMEFAFTFEAASINLQASINLHPTVDIYSRNITVGLVIDC